jgi:acyl-CoA thioesterase FadM
METTAKDFKLGFIFGITISFILSPFLPNVSYLISNSQYLVSLITKTHDNMLLNDDLNDEIENIVQLSDIDGNFHMNNSRYFYHLNYSRRRLFYKIGIWQILHQNNINMIIQAQNIRYRKELKLYQKYKIYSKILNYNDKEKCFYVESKFLSFSNNFVLAIHHVKYKLVNGNKNKDINIDKYLSPSYLLKEIGISNYNLIETSLDNDLMSYINIWEKSNKISSLELNPNKSYI